MTVENINEWRKDVFEKYEYETTEGGKFPHRTGSTVHAMNLDALSIISIWLSMPCELKTERANGLKLWPLKRLECWLIQWHQKKN